MRRACRKLVLFICLLIAISGCKKLTSLLKGESENWREQMDKSVGELTAAVDKAALAIPGERYHRLIDAAIGDDHKEKEKAIAQVKKLFNIELDTLYEVELRFGHDDKKPLHADFFFGAAPSATSVVHYCASKVTFKPLLVRNALAKPANWADIDAKINSELLAAVEALGAKTDAVRVITGTHSAQKFTRFKIQRDDALSLNIPFGAKLNSQTNETEVNGSYSQETLENQVRRKQAALHLRNAVDAIYGDLKIPRAGTSLPARDFSPVSGTPLLVVLIPDRELAEQKDIVIEVSVFKKQTADEIKNKKPRETLNQRWPITFNKADFVDEPLDCGKPAIKVRYTMHNLTEIATVSPEVLEAVIKTRKLMDDWKKLQTANPS